MKTRMVGHSKSGDCPIAELYDDLLRKYNSAEIKGIAIIPSAFEFDDLYNQRTINLAKHLSDDGYGVIYVAWQWHKGEILERNYQYVFKNVIQVPLYEFIETHHKLKIFLPLPDKKYIIMLPAKIFCDLVFFMKENFFHIYYDIMDDWEQFHAEGQAPWYIRSVEEAALLNADRITAVSMPLVQKFAFLRADITLVGNGLYPKLLGEPIAHKKAENKKPNNKITIGYFGHLTDSWFDWDMLFQMLKKHEEIHLEVIGYGASEATRSTAQKYANIELLGKINPRDLHKYAAGWDVAIIPFKKSTLSEAVDPIKIYEYLYLGLPTVVTGIPHLKDYPYVEVTENDPESFYQATMKLYEKRLCGAVDYSVISDFLSDKTWNKRFEQMFEKNFLTKLYW